MNWNPFSPPTNYEDMLSQNQMLQYQWFLVCDNAQGIPYLSWWQQSCGVNLLALANTMQEIQEAGFLLIFIFMFHVTWHSCEGLFDICMGSLLGRDPKKLNWKHPSLLEHWLSQICVNSRTKSSRRKGLVPISECLIATCRMKNVILMFCILMILSFIGATRDTHKLIGMRAWHPSNPTFFRIKSHAALVGGQIWDFIGLASKHYWIW
jgi:hypothetical protein